MTLSDTPSDTSLSLLDLLTVGNVVTAGVQIYRAHWNAYMKIALTAVLWLLIPVLALIPLVLVATTGGTAPILGLLGLLWLVGVLYGFARYLAESALIARLAFGDLIHQSESINAARRYLRGLLWRFFWVSILVGVLTFVVFIGLYILASVLLFAVLGGMGTFSGLGSVSTSVDGLFIAVVVFSVLGVVFTVLAGTLWFTARMAIADIPLAIEQGIGAVTSVGRSWTLTAGGVWRLMLILTVAFLITLPMLLLTQLVVTVLQQGLGQVFDVAPSTYIALSPILGYALGLVGNVLLLPLWQCIRAVIYYDLRSRREGYGLRLSHRPTMDAPTDFSPDREIP